MLSPSDLKAALKLYDAYQCEGREYRELAARYGMPITDLNAMLWRHRKIHPKTANARAR